MLWLLLASLSAAPTLAQSQVPQQGQAPQQGQVPQQGQALQPSQVPPSLAPPAGAFQPPAPSAPAPQAEAAKTADCRTLVERLRKLMEIYRAAAADELKGQPIDVAMDKARKAALAGKKEATVAMVGYTSLINAREGSFPITTVRQVCTFAERNGLPLHLATCAYFDVLNPLGETEAKAKAARKLIAQFEAGQAQPADLVEHVSTLKACLPQK